MRNLIKLLTYFVVIGLILVAPLAKKMPLSIPFDFLGAIIITFLLSLILLLIESLAFRTFTGLKCFSAKKVISFCVLLVCVMIFGGGTINRQILNKTLPREVLLEVIPNGEDAKGNIWIVGPDVRVVEYADFVEVEENHFVSETGTPWMKIEVLNIKQSSVTLICNDESGDVRISFNGHSKTYTGSKAIPGQKTISLIYHDRISIQRIMLYGILILLCTILLYIVVKILKGWTINLYMKKKISSFLALEMTRKNMNIVFIAVGVLFSLYGFTNFEFVSSYLASGNGDTVWYWTVGDSAFLQTGKLSFENFIIATKGLEFRGYLVPMFFLLLKIISVKILKIEPLLFCFVVLSFMASCLNNILLPYIYEVFNKEMKLHMKQVLLMNLCFFCFLRGHILWPMADLISFACIVSGLFFFLRFLNSKKYIYLFGNFFFLIAGVLCRRNYVVLFYIELFWLLAWMRKGNLNLLSAVKLILSVLAGIFLISTPQVIINCIRDGSWEYLGGSIDDFAGSQSLIENSMQLTLDTATQAWPYFLKNALGPLMKNSIYPGMEELKLMDALYIFVSHPLESICFIISKAFMAVDIRTAMVYPEAPYIDLKETGVVLLILNAIVWSAFALSISGKKMIDGVYKKGEKIIGLVVILFLFIPLLAVHIEWRYFIPFYFLAYYGVCFCLPRWFADAKMERKKRFLVYLAILSVIFIIISINNYANLPWNNPGGVIFGD